MTDYNYTKQRADWKAYPDLSTPIRANDLDGFETALDLHGDGLNAHEAAIALLAPLASPALTGTPTAPTPSANDNDTSIATTAFVQNEIDFFFDERVGNSDLTLTTSYQEVPNCTIAVTSTGRYIVCAIADINLITTGVGVIQVAFVDAQNNLNSQTIRYEQASHAERLTLSASWITAVNGAGNLRIHAKKTIAAGSAEIKASFSAISAHQIVKTD